MIYPKLFRLGVLILIVIALLRWISPHQELPTFGDLAQGIQSSAGAIAVLAALGIWGLRRAMANGRTRKGGKQP